MKCKQGDLARIIYSIRTENIGRIVKVREYIGKHKQGDVFEFREISCMCAVTDHFWWIEAEDIATGLGVSPQAYIPDSWLEPIRPEANKETQKEEIDIAA